MAESRALIVWVMLTFVGVMACESLPERAPKLSELQVGDGAKRSGKWLMSLEEGMSRLDESTAELEVLDVVVHGYDSRGYEWIHALKRFGAAGHEVWFYRWDWNVCPAEGAAKLRTQLQALLAKRPTAKRVRVVGHSYGGVITALMGNEGPLELPLDVHVIAAPLAGMGKMKSLCGFTGLKTVTAAPGVRWFQWRTQHALDGAFRDEKVDPQLVDFGAGSVTLLPESYRGHRLGHNWSVSWVADELTEAK